MPDFLYIWSKQVEHNKWPFFFQNVLVDLSISFLQIKHLNIGDILRKLFAQSIYQIYIKKFFTHFLEFQRNINNNEKSLLGYITTPSYQNKKRPA